MSRIRTIKPDFWQHPKTGSVCRDARLLFLGLLNEADDDGRMRYSAKRLSGVLFSFDDDVTPDVLQGWVNELERGQLVETYTVDGAAYLAVPGFGEHQRINRKTDSLLPVNPHDALTEDAVSAHDISSDVVHREGNGKGMEQGEGTSADAEPAPKVASRIRAHRWASNVTSEEVNEAIFVLRQERIPDRILVEALELAEAFPSKWKTQARKLHTERTPARVERPWCESCGFSGMVLNEQNLAEPCPDCRPLPSLELVAEA